MKLYTFFLFILFPWFSYSQPTKIIFDNQTPINDGIYLSIKQILENLPEYPFNLEKAHQQFSDSFDENIFAYVEDGTLYIHFNHNFYKVMIKGTISIFNIEMTYTNYPSGYSFSKDNIYFIDFQTGNIKKLNLQNLDEVLMGDQTLYEEFSKLSNSKRRKSLLLYVMNYNKRNPIFIQSK